MYQLKWPNSETVTIEDFRSELAFVLNSQFDQVDRAIVARSGQPGLLIFCQVGQSEWQRIGDDGLRHFLEFWANLPDTRRTDTLIVCVCLLLEDADSQQSILNLSGSSNYVLRQFLADAEEKAITVGLLPPLSLLTVDDITQFGTLEVVTQFCNAMERIPDWHADALKIFQTKTYLPLELIIDEIRDLLAHYSGRPD
jgi:hypothetical protein